MLALASLTHITTLYAQQGGDRSGFRTSLGAGMAIKNNIRVGNIDEDLNNDPIYTPVPFASFAWGPVQLSGRGLNFAFYNTPVFSASLILSRFGDKYKADGMATRKAGFFAGAGVRIFGLSVNFKKDIDNDSRGTILDFSWNQRLPPLFKTSIFPALRIGAEYWSQKLLSYHFGVRPSEVTATRPLYNPTGGWAYILGLNFIIKHTDTITTMIGPNFKYYGKQVDDSPTVAKNEELSLFFATFFTF